VTQTRPMQSRLTWQSKAVLLLVLPFVGAGLVLHVHWWWTQSPAVVVWALGLSGVLALVVLRVRAATVGGALTGAALTASLMFSTVSFPYRPWNTALPAVLAVSALAWLATKAGRATKERLGTAEAKRGRVAAQVAANLGMAALLSFEPAQAWVADHLHATRTAQGLVFALGLAALAEAAADTVSSEIGQVLGGRPVMITTLSRVDPGTDGGVSLAGTAAGMVAGALVAAIGAMALSGGGALFFVSWIGGVFGLLFDSVLGATLERRGWLNNDAVNFVSTASAAGLALLLMAVDRR
jgi:uncharacterized protein (TIGR00297 family)